MAILVVVTVLFHAQSHYYRQEISHEKAGIDSIPLHDESGYEPGVVR